MATKAHSPPSAASKRPDAACILSDRLPLAPWRVILSCGALDARDVTRLSSCSRTCLARARREDVWAALCKHALAVGGALPGAAGAIKCISPEKYITTASNKPDRATAESAVRASDDSGAAASVSSWFSSPVGSIALAGAGGLGADYATDSPHVPGLPPSCHSFKAMCVHSRRARRFQTVTGTGDAMTPPRAICKALMCGPRTSGRAALMRCVQNNCVGVPYDRDLGFTIGVDFVIREVEAKPLRPGDDVTGPDGSPLRVKIQLWRDPNTLLFSRARPMPYGTAILRGVDHLLFSYDLSVAAASLSASREHALNVLTAYDTLLRECYPMFSDIPQMAVLATHLDRDAGLAPKSGDDAHAFAAELAACSKRTVPVLAVNSETGEGVEDLMVWLGSTYAVQTKGEPEGYEAKVIEDTRRDESGGWGCSVM